MLLIIASLFKTNNIAANAEHIAVVARIILTPYIVVKYLINTYCYLFYIQIDILFVCVLNNATHKY